MHDTGYQTPFIFLAVSELLYSSCDKWLKIAIVHKNYDAKHRNAKFLSNHIKHEVRNRILHTLANY